MSKELLTGVEINRNGSKYTDEERRAVVGHYFVTGSETKTSELTNVPRPTINGWRNTDWWHQMYNEVRRQKTEEHRAKFTELVDQAIDRSVEALPTATAAQAATIAGIAFDKTRLIDNMPTKISSNTGSMEALAKRFEEISRQQRAITESVVSEQQPGDES